ncbi:MAG: RluA family pseudouridine synthase [Christensenellales bacterium]
MSARRYVCPAEGAGSRLDRFLAERCEELTRSRLQKLIDQGQVQVNGRAAKASEKLRAGDAVSLVLPEAEPVALVAEDIPLRVCYEDAFLAVIDKPAGMVVHPAAGHAQGTLVNALLFAMDDLSGINGEKRPGIVHRLDKDTTGLIVIAKNDRAHQGLAAQLADHSMHRVYLALAEGRFKQDQGTVSTCIGRDPRDRKRMAVLPQGREAVTDYAVEEAFDQASLVRLRLHTGRTHQIRVHMAYLHHPLLGDPLYGPKKPRLGLGRQMLHAHEIHFIHPVTGAAMDFSAPPPADFINTLEKLRQAQKDGRRLW